METRVAVIADYASISLGDKLNILGIFTKLYASNVPVTHPQMQLVAQFEFDSSERGTKNLTIMLMDEDGKELFSFSQPSEIRKPDQGRTVLHNLMLTLNVMTFPAFGNYEFKILINDTLVATVPLEVVQIPAPANVQR